MKTKLIDGFYKLKSYWYKPPKGYEVSYKEFTNFTIGSSANGMLSILIQWTTLAVTTPMIASYFQITSGLVAIMGIIGLLIALVRDPIISMLMDNSRSNNGKFKPFLIWTCIVSALAFCFVPFIPQAWNSQNLFTIQIPAVAMLGIVKDSVPITLGVLVMFILVQIGTTIFQILSRAMMGIENTISSVAQERANIGSIKGLLCNLPNSIVNIVIPLVAAFFFTGVGFTKNNEGMFNINLYRIFFPICAILSLAFVLFLYFGTKEKAVVNKKYVNKVKFFKGAKELSKNKYFWIITAFTIAIGIRAHSNISYYAAMYSIGGVVGNSVWSACQMLLNNAMIPGMILGPILIKKFGKRNVLNCANLFLTIMVALQYLFLKNPYLILVGVFFQNLSSGVMFISAIMISDALDYQQFKTGKRMEGLWHSYTAFIGTLVGFFTMFLEPIFMSFGGVSFGMKIQEAMTDPILRDNVYLQKTNLAMIGCVIAMVPMLFYNLSENKHANIVSVLKIRRAVDNYNDNNLDDRDIIDLKNIMDMVDKTNNDYNDYMATYDENTIDKKLIRQKKKMLDKINNMKIVIDELDKDKDLLKDIIKDYDEAIKREGEKDLKVEMEILSRNIELEEQIMKAKIGARRRSAAKKKIEFDEAAYIQECIDNSRFMKNKEQLEEYNSTQAELLKQQENAQLVQEITTTTDDSGDTNN